MAINQTQIADKWQQKWKEKKIFHPQQNDKEKFFITVPYPYISGSLHIGHARVVTEADVYSRFQRLKGKNVLYPMAFHISGTPVLGISTALKMGDEKKTKLYTNYVRQYVSDENEVQKIIKSFEEPQNIVDFFIPKMVDEFSSLGLGVDWSRSFTSGDAVHRKLVEWQFKKYEEKGFLVRGKYPVLFSTLYQNAAGEDDIADGDVSPVEKQDFTLIKFKHEDYYLIAATLRPETLYGQTNLWIHPDIDYVKARVDDEIWIISKECVEKLSYQDKKVEEIQTIKGRDLLGKTCFAPFIEKDITILPSMHCDPDKGTGIVTSVPSDAPFDWIVLKQLQDSKELCNSYNLDHNQISQIKPISIINLKGYGDLPAIEICQKMNITSLDQKDLLDKATQEIYKAGFHTGTLKDNCEEFANKKVAQAKEDMKQKLIQSPLGDLMWETSRPAKDRANGKIVVAILDNQWFLDFNANEWKKTAHEVLNNLEIQPNKFRKRFEDVFDWLDKRPCARKRGLGTKLPQDPKWVIESLSDSTLYMSAYTISAKLNEYNIGEESLTPEFFDYVYTGKGNVEEASQKAKIPKEQLQDLRDQFNYWYPLDQRHTFTAHLANHLSFCLFAHAALLPKEYWPKKFSFHGMVLSGGQKMSKSKGNVVSLLTVKNDYGADTFRAAMCSTTSVESTFNWDEKEMRTLKNHIDHLFDTLQNAYNNQTQLQDIDALSPAAKAFISKTEKGLQKITTALEHMDLRAYANFVLYELTNNYKKIKRTLTEEELNQVNDYIAEKWTILLSPLTPHIAEELYANKRDDFVSLAPWPAANKDLINDMAEFEVDIKENTIKDVRNVMSFVNIQNPKNIKLIIAHEWKYDFLKEFKHIFEKTKNPSDIIKHIMQNDELKKQGKNITKLIASLTKDPSKIPMQSITKDQEQTLLNTIKDDLAKEFGCEVLVELAEESKENKANAAFPSKPGIVVE